MARTVAEIDGDSSGLVGALDKGKAGMEKMEAEGKKLSDQLREVTDSADKAAGAIVQKIGGPKAITALAGAGAALGAAKMAADFFLNSVEKLFKSMGDEGMKVWNDVEMALDSISGAFAKAVLGGGSAEEMGKKLITVFSGLAKIVEAIVTYGFPALRLGFEGLTIAMEKLNEWTGKGVENFDALKRSQDNYANATSVTNVENLTKAYADLSAKVQGLVGETTALAMAANDETIAQIKASQATFLKVGNTIRDLEIRKQVEKSRDVIERNAAAEVANLDLSKYGASWKMVAEREMADRVATKTAELYSSIAKQFAEKGKDAYSFMPEALKLSFDAAAADLSLLEERGEQLYDQYLGKGPTAPKTGGGAKPPKPPGEDPAAAALEAARAKMDAAMATSQKQLEGVQKLLGLEKPEEFSIFSSIKDAATFIADGATEAAKVYNSLVETVTTGNGKIQESNELTLTKEQEAQRANYDQFINQNAKMVATSLAGGATIADAARAALGSIVTGLGDKAMSEAAIQFALGNVAGAVALTAAGAAAYATGAFLGSTEKKSAAATKATAPAAAPVTNNQTNFNLRVDAAFADEESIARSFARAQRLASNRYMGAGY